MSSRDINDQRKLLSDRKKGIWTHPVISGSLRCYLSLMIIFIFKKKNRGYQLIPSRDIDN